eukprot:5010399-Prymnesium_polylepis.1
MGGRGGRGTTSRRLRGQWRPQVRRWEGRRWEVAATGEAVGGASLGGCADGRTVARGANAQCSARAVFAAASRRTGRLAAMLGVGARDRLVRARRRAVGAILGPPAEVESALLAAARHVLAPHSERVRDAAPQ